MEPLSHPDPQEVVAVETSLYNRMVKNAFFGFMKSAVIGGIIGLALGGIAAAIGILPAAAIAGDMGPVIEGALRIGVSFAGVAGSFGAVAGIQSTRDTRRFFMMHEGRHLSPEETREQLVAVAPQVTEPCKDKAHFQNLVSQTSDPLHVR